ncbi:hypothetical protein KCP78_02990 [Salmonella enterica subsp. enterica]|nr:hypothetical protein KCP78_02990 [Salmonella enterica subsp. enterica]
MWGSRFNATSRRGVPDVLSRLTRPFRARRASPPGWLTPFRVQRIAQTRRCLTG